MTKKQLEVEELLLNRIIASNNFTDIMAAAQAYSIFINACYTYDSIEINHTRFALEYGEN